MIRYFLGALLLIIVVACNQQARETKEEAAAELPSTGVFGDSITEAGALPADTLPVLLSDLDSLDVKLSGTIASVCQRTGCWIDIDLGNGSTMKVLTSHEFFMPMDAAGKFAVVEGRAYKELVSVEMLRHFAEDEGKSEEEIAAITEPEMSYTFVAHGVIIREQ